MTVTPRHALRQGAVVRALLRAGLASLRGSSGRGAPDLPGPLHRKQVPPRADDLVDDYVRHCGGDPAAYAGVLPPHLFPQWGFPVLSRTLRAVPYDLARILNGGCRIEVHRPLPRGEPLQLTGCLEDIDDNGRRAVLKNRLVTGTASAPSAISAWVYGVVPLPHDKSAGTKKERPTVPVDATHVHEWSLRPSNGVDFAVLTGDFNPIHWLWPYARLAGFGGTILHGFATLAYAMEALREARFGGDPSRLRAIDVKFTKPVPLPSKMGLYVRGTELFMGDAPGGPANLVGTFEQTGTYEESPNG